MSERIYATWSVQHREHDQLWEVTRTENGRTIFVGAYESRDFAWGVAEADRQYHCEDPQYEELRPVSLGHPRRRDHVRRRSIRIPGYVPVATYGGMLAGTHAGWIIGTLIYHWAQR